jgi:hypothetical protein
LLKNRPAGPEPRFPPLGSGGSPSMRGRENVSRGRDSVKGTVLIIDDEEPIRTFLSDVFERAGYAVALAGDGRKGLSRAFVVVGTLYL